jgi:acetylornithine/N-succinyldiaminopimelate aminotransferase
MHINERPPQIMQRGAGSWLFDSEDNAYLDFVQGWAVNALGHCPEELQRALATQASTLLTASPAFRTGPAEQLAARLTRASGLQRAFLCNSGAEANECASKLARKWGQTHRGGAFEIITTENAFHGRTLAMMTASGKPGWDQLFPPNIEGFKKVPFGDLDAVRAQLSQRTCAVMVEPIQGEAGVIVPPAGYLAALRALTRDHGVLLIFDEVQTGFGRTGTLFRFQCESDARPDIMTLGKGLGGGVPLAAVLATEDAACFKPGDHGGTYCGNPLMASCGIALFDVVSDVRFLERVQQAGARLQAGLAALAAERGCPIAELRGAGLLQAVTLQRPCSERVVEQARSRGLLLNAPRPNSLRFMPSLRVTDDEIALMLERLRASLRAVN